jgi:hypothetical protein
VPAPAPAAPVAAPTPIAAFGVDVRDDSKTALARQKLSAESTKYNELLSRIQAANIELDVTRAAFKYQYTVVRPPELARRPSKPNVLLIDLATLVFALLLTLVIPAGLDIWRGRFVEQWQVEQRLKLPVLGDLSLPP